MKNSNPFNMSGPPLERPKPQSDARLKLIMAAVVAATVLLFSGLFIQGCQRHSATASNDELPGSGTPSTSPMPTTAEEPATTNTTVAAAATDTNGPGMTASTPTPSDTVSTPVSSAAKEYTVVKGDSFYKIAKANHITTAALTAANPGIDSAKLKVGQKINLPQAAETGATTSSVATASSSASTGTASAPESASADKSSGDTTKYVVKSGDTLGRIAKAHGTTVKALKAANGLTNDRIAVGKTLKLPQGKASGSSA